MRHFLCLLVSMGLLACKAKPSPKSQQRESSPSDQQKASASESPVRKDGTILAESQLMGTRVSINVYVGQAQDLAPEKTKHAQDTIRQAFQEIARIESIASEWIPQSELSKLSASAGSGWQSVSPDLWQLLAQSVEISKETNGLFDISFHGVGQLWSFKKGATPPQDAAIKAALDKVGYQGIELDESNHKARLTRAGMALGMGAIAKGYGVDKAAQLLQKAGYPNFIVEAGGDTFVSGKKNDKAWRVGIQDPAGPGAIGALEVTNKAVVTSGNYERFFVHQGVHYTHILHPKTGRPIKRDESPRSVTIVAPTATMADAYCTAIAVMGREKGLAFVASRPDLETIIVDADGKLYLSEGLAQRYQRLKGPKAQPK